MIPTGSKDLDNLIQNYKGITIIYGEGATGKTLCCLQATKNAKNNKIIFLDTENSFSIERLQQLDENYKEYLNNILLLKIKSFKEQSLKIKALQDIKNISLIILDGIGMHYRRLVKRNSDLANAMLITQLKILNKISKTTPVIITNQVYMDIKQQKLVMLADKTYLKNFADTIIRLDINPRKLTVIKPGKKYMYFEIKNKGIFKLP